MTTIPLPWTVPPLTGNRDRANVHAYAAKVRATKDEAVTAIRAANVTPMTGANITLHLRAATKRRRDADNLGPTLKVVQDALVLEGVLPDDSWVHVPKSACHIHPPSDEGPAMWVTLEAVA